MDEVKHATMVSAVAQFLPNIFAKPNYYKYLSTVFAVCQPMDGTFFVGVLIQVSQTTVSGDVRLRSIRSAVELVMTAT